MRPAVLGLVLCCACGGVKVVAREPTAPLQIVGAFVYPFGFRWEEPAYRSFEMSQRLLDVALDTAGDELSFWGPDEFRVMRASDDGAWVASTALPVLIGSGARPEQGLIIRPWAEQRVSGSSQEVQDNKGRARGGSASQETVYIGHVEVIHPSTREVLVEAEGTVTIDPFAEASPEADFDPAPPLTHLMEALMRAAVKKAAKFAATRAQQKLPELTLAVTPSATLRWQDEGRASAEVEMAKMDSVSLDLFLQVRARFLNPQLNDGQASKLTKLPPGLYVRGPIADPKWKLEEGDLLIAFDDVKASRQAFCRLRFAHAPSQVKVRKATGETTEVLLP
jgi:hypothetical protein